MRIEAFLVCWNESAIMPLVIKHYAKFCDKITILDNYSTDGSDKLAESLGCEVVKFGTKFFDDLENLTIKNNCWRNSTADFVCVTDFDECLYLDDENDIKSYLHGSTHHVYRPIGWQIMSDQMPQDDLLEIKTGYRFDNYSKCVLFDPKLKSIEFNPGAHRCNPKADFPISISEMDSNSLYLLHYKHIGGLQRTIDRYKEYQPRMSKNNRKNRWGIHYWRTVESLREEWNERMAKSKPLI